MAKKKIWVSVGDASDNYGFGSNWTLHIGKKNFWLGQGAKVTSRMLGYDYNYYIENVMERAGIKNKFANEKAFFANKKVNKIVAEDIIDASGGEYNQILKEPDWGLAVQ